MARFDYAVDDDGDLIFENGDLKIVESSQQHIEEIIISTPGEIRDNPVLGVGAAQFINSVNSENELMIRIRKQLKKDGFAVKSITIENGVIKVSAT